MKAQIVSFHCVLKDKVGKVLSSTFNRDVLTGIEEPGQMLKGLSETLQNLEKGQKKSVFIAAEEAYGLYDPDLVIEVPRKRLSPTLQVGHQILSEGDEGDDQLFRVTQMTHDSITLDANHPLAGQDLIFEIETVEARDATQDEIADSHFKSSVPYFH